MQYAILCYHDEAEVGSWSKEEDDAVLATRARVGHPMVDFDPVITHRAVGRSGEGRK